MLVTATDSIAHSNPCHCGSAFIRLLRFERITVRSHRDTMLPIWHLQLCLIMTPIHRMIHWYAALAFLTKPRLVRSNIMIAHLDPMVLLHWPNLKIAAGQMPPRRLLDAHFYEYYLEYSISVVQRVRCTKP